MAMGLLRTTIFSIFAVCFFGYFRDEAVIITQRYTVRCLNGYFALNSVFAPVWQAETMRHSKNNCMKLIKIDTYCQFLAISGLCRYSVGFSRKETLKDSGVVH